MQKSLLENPRLAMIAVVLGMTVLALDLLTPMGVAIPMLYSGLVLLGLWSPHPRFTIITTIMATVFSILGLLVSPPGGVVWIGITNRLMALLLLWVTAILVLRHKHVEQTTKVLHGLLPICAWCKKIRDDEGYWKRLEDYMEQHTEAHFTHGMCTECAAKFESTPAAERLPKTPG
jgi:hypothetical protein